MDGCLPDPDKKYPFRSDGPANFAFSASPEQLLLVLYCTYCFVTIHLVRTVLLSISTVQLWVQRVVQGVQWVTPNALPLGLSNGPG